METPAPGPLKSTDLIACPECDLLHRAAAAPPGGRLRCMRCARVLLTNQPGALDRALASALSSVILMAAAIFFPFLELSAIGIHQRASVLDAALAFSSGTMIPLAVATGLLIVVVPLLRAIALSYVLIPLRASLRPLPGSRVALRLSASLKPWSMAEIFIIGVAVALVKVAGLATIGFGPAFWAMACLVLIVSYEGSSLCEWTIWQALENSRRA